MIHLHIRYDEDDSIEDELNEYFLEGKTAIKARQIKKGKRKNASDGRQKKANLSNEPTIAQRTPMIPTRTTPRSTKSNTIMILK